jgi:hypothetical protein
VPKGNNRFDPDSNSGVETVVFQGTGEAKYPGFKKVLDADSLDA